MLYLASGWFTEEQERARLDILQVMGMLGLVYYSPKDRGILTPDKDPNDVFLENLCKINESDAVVASTVGKDVGTMWECGYAFAKNTPIIYYFPMRGVKFNLMLAQSGMAVARDKLDLNDILMTYKRTGSFSSVCMKQFRGDIE